MSGRPELKIDWATHAAAKYACENWHYTGRIPVNKLVKIGAWEGGVFIGVVIFGVGASAQVHKQFGVKPTECAELVRVALRSHNWEVSKIVSLAVRFLRRQCPGLRVLVSFADPSQSHHGGIYQAMGWAYTGASHQTTEYWYNGAWRHVTDVYKRLDPSAVKALKSRKAAGKYRYVLPLDKEMAAQIEPLRRPYPKRPTKANPSDQEGSGGAVPTRTLQLLEGDDA